MRTINEAGSPHGQPRLVHVAFAVSTVVACVLYLLGPQWVRLGIVTVVSAVPIAAIAVGMRINQIDRRGTWLILLLGSGLFTIFNYLWFMDLGLGIPVGAAGPGNLLVQVAAYLCVLGAALMVVVRHGAGDRADRHRPDHAGVGIPAPAAPAPDRLTRRLPGGLSDQIAAADGDPGCAAADRRHRRHRPYRDELLLRQPGHGRRQRGGLAADHQGRQRLLLAAGRPVRDDRLPRRGRGGPAPEREGLRPRRRLAAPRADPGEPAQPRPGARAGAGGRQPAAAVRPRAGHAAAVARHAAGDPAGHHADRPAAGPAHRRPGGAALPGPPRRADRPGQPAALLRPARRGGPPLPPRRAARPRGPLLRPQQIQNHQ